MMVPSARRGERLRTDSSSGVASPGSGSGDRPNAVR